VATRTVMCPWDQRQAFLRDESRWKTLQEAAARDYDPVVEEAIGTVFEATGEETGFIRVWSVERERAQRLSRRAGLDGPPDQHPLAYTDRRGHSTFHTRQRFSSRRPSPPRSPSRASITSRNRKMACAPKATSLDAESATMCCGTCGQPIRWYASGRRPAN
jgi:hypothetical protein